MIICAFRFAKRPGKKNAPDSKEPAHEAYLGNQSELSAQKTKHDSDSRCLMAGGIQQHAICIWALVLSKPVFVETIEIIGNTSLSYPTFLVG